MKKCFNDYYIAATKNALFLFLMALFVVTSLLHMSYVPIWDGRAFVQEYMQSEVYGRFYKYLNHSCYWHGTLFGLTQRIDYGNYHLVYLLQLMLGIVGLVTFYLLLKHLPLKDQLTKTERALITFYVGFNPVFLAQVIQPSLDFPLVIYLIILMYMLVTRKLFWVPLIGLMLMFTKETGSMLYVVAVFLYFLFFGFETLEIPDSLGKMARGSAMVIPVILFSIYIHSHVPNSMAGSSWRGVINRMCASGLGPATIDQLKVIFGINFNWILTIVIMLAIFFKRKLFFENRKAALYIFSCTILVVFFLTRLPLDNNPRYMMSVLPLFILLFALCLFSLIKKYMIRVIVLSIVLSLIYVSAFVTIDPVSKLLFGTIKFGSHDILDMRGLHRGPSWWFQDQMVYNYEFMKISDLTQKIINQIGVKNKFVASDWATIYADADIRNWDESLDPKGGFKIATLKNVWKEKYDSLYYILYPNYGNGPEITALSSFYNLKEEMVFQEDGYAIHVIHMVRKT